MNNQEPIKVLFRGWVNIPHSYAIVNCFQLIHLYLNYGPDGRIKKNAIEIYIQEQNYYNPEWNNKKKLVYTPEYNKIISKFKVARDDQKYDLIYSITYPYDINVTNIDRNVPKIVFYTSEFAKINSDYFSIQKPDGLLQNDYNQYMKHFLNEFKNIYFTSPSVWSSQGIKDYLSIESEQQRNRIITHGVDTTIFYPKKTKRNAIRKMYNVNKDDILLISTGSMTKNKGIVLILQAMYILVNEHNQTKYKLMLKGTGDLYQSKLFLEVYFKELINNGFTQELIDNMLNYIIFTDSTVSFETMNDLFNASDIFLAPYLAEGFCLTPLEALASGSSVIVPKTGSTKEYIQNISDNGGSNLINYVESHVVQDSNGLCQNIIAVLDLINTIKNVQVKNDVDIYAARNYIENELSWNKVSELLMEYFNFILLE